MDAPSNFLSRVGLAISMYASSKASDGDGGGAGGPVAEEEQSFSSIRNSELYPHNSKVVDKGCPATVKPFPLLSGEALEYIGLLAEDSYIAISNYRFFVSRQNGFFNVPTGLVDSVDLYGSKEQTVVLCKDGGSFCVSFGSQSHCTMWLDRLRRAICGARDLDKTFAFVHWAYSRDQATTPTRNQATPPALNGGKPLLNSEYGQVYSSDVVRAEFRRMQMDVGGSWRISDCNCEYKLCPTYPKLLVVPSSLTEEEIRSAAKFRALGRFPTVVWRHTGNGSVIARSSQPLVGVLGWRNPEDEKLLHAVSLSCSTPVTGHAPSNGSSSPVPIPYRNGGPLAQMMDDRGQMVQSVFMNNGE
jgi:myotubularin-related protein 3/4